MRHGPGVDMPPYPTHLSTMASIGRSICDLRPVPFAVVSRSLVSLELLWRTKIAHQPRSSLPGCGVICRNTSSRVLATTPFCFGYPQAFSPFARFSRHGTRKCINHQPNPHLTIRIPFSPAIPRVPRTAMEGNGTPDGQDWWWEHPLNISRIATSAPCLRPLHA